LLGVGKKPHQGFSPTLTYLTFYFFSFHFNLYMKMHIFFRENSCSIDYFQKKFFSGIIFYE